jgi:glutamyl-tRNA synthetase
MNYKELADLLFPDVTKTIEDYEKIYPKRNLPDGAIVTRFAPSPTGFLHIGGLLASFIEKKMANQTNGVFYLRIEDTDQKREIENGINGIINGLNDYDITYDEGPINEEEYKGSYGPYVQSERKQIYQTFAKYLVENDLAYPCFCSEEEIECIRIEQEKCKERIGYYGSCAKYRNTCFDEIKKRIENGEKYTIRLKSKGSFNNKKIFYDLVKGEIEMPENDLDTVLIKSDGLPVYHFAHLVDDYLMRTTHVIRGDEWLSSLPIHVQLFEYFGFEVPKYAHISPLLKNDNGALRKISKRKDPEASVGYYKEKGIPAAAIREYLATVANSNYELWREQNPEASIDKFTLSFNKISSSGSLFDMDKLINISKNYISRLKADYLYEMTLNWANEFDKDFADLLIKYKDYTINTLNIEREVSRPRKDISSFSEVKKETLYMYDELFFNNVKFDNIEIKSFYDSSLIEVYMNNYFNENDDKETWFSKIKEFAGANGFASETKEYKLNPDNYKGHVGDVCELIRVIVTGRTMSPDLYEILKLLGKDRILKRIQHFNDVVKK